MFNKPKPRFIHNKHFWSRFHAVMTCIWLILLIPSLVWWKESLPWLVAMSVWANVGSHWSAFQASKGEEG